MDARADGWGDGAGMGADLCAGKCAEAGAEGAEAVVGDGGRCGGRGDGADRAGMRAHADDMDCCVGAVLGMRTLLCPVCAGINSFRQSPFKFGVEGRDCELLAVGFLDTLEVSVETEFVDDLPRPRPVNEDLAADHVGVRPC